MAKLFVSYLSFPFSLYESSTLSATLGSFSLYPFLSLSVLLSSSPPLLLSHVCVHTSPQGLLPKHICSRRRELTSSCSWRCCPNTRAQITLDTARLSKNVASKGKTEVIFKRRDKDNCSACVNVSFPFSLYLLSQHMCIHTLRHTHSH